MSQSNSFVLAGLMVSALSVHLPAQGEPVTYKNDIKPILERHCVECHSGWFPDGGLRLDSLDAIHEGGNQGRAIIPGQPDKGWLINLVRPRAGHYSKMPPGPASLSDAQIELLRRWIAAGARN